MPEEFLSLFDGGRFSVDLEVSDRETFFFDACIVMPGVAVPARQDRQDFVGCIDQPMGDIARDIVQGVRHHFLRPPTTVAIHQDKQAFPF